jgi:hypothetical protein
MFRRPLRSGTRSRGGRAEIPSREALVPGLGVDIEGAAIGAAPAAGGVTAGWHAHHLHDPSAHRPCTGCFDIRASRSQQVGLTWNSRACHWVLAGKSVGHSLH